MAQCVFCGDKAAFGKTITVGTMQFKACADCYEKYHGRNDKEIVDAVWSAGISNDGASLENWYKDRQESLKEKAELLRNEIADLKSKLEKQSAGTCPKCGGTMLKGNDLSILAYSGGLPTLNLSSLNTDYMTVHVLTCDQCGYIEFYSAASSAGKLLKQKETQLEEITAELGEE